MGTGLIGSPGRVAEPGRPHVERRPPSCQGWRTMLGRLLIGIVKGLLGGSLLGFALVKLGAGVPIALVAYLAAAVTGVLIGLVAGKPIWAKDAKIEAGTKAFVGALLALGLMAAARTWLWACGAQRGCTILPTLPAPRALPQISWAERTATAIGLPFRATRP